MATTYVGKPLNRVDGRDKVTGRAAYAAEHFATDLAYGVVVSAGIARGRIAAIDAAEALELPGVLEVFTHANVPKLAKGDDAWKDEIAPPGSPFRPLASDVIKFSGQPIALVVAETWELARYAATRVRVAYDREVHATDLNAERRAAREPSEGAEPPDPRGDADEALRQAAAKIDAEYLTPVEHHNPMEPFATTVVRDENGRLTVFDKTQGVQNVRDYLVRVFDLEEDDLRVAAPFVGGAFGSGLRPIHQVFLAVLAATRLKRSVRVVLTRRQMFTFGHRPTTRQRIALGAAADGKLAAVIHEVVQETSRFEDYTETIVDWSGLCYRSDNVRLERKLVPLDVYTPSDMRGPGAAWGVYALECALDELAAEVGVDPIELRLRNYADRDQNQKRPFSSKELRACYAAGAERFGWKDRDPRPRSMRRGERLVGYGMAGGIWEAMQLKASAKATLSSDGRLTVGSATEDIGTGTYTILTQIAADSLGVPIEDVTVQLGDSSLPQAPVEGGSFTASTVGSAVEAACTELRNKLLRLRGDRRDLSFIDVLRTNGFESLSAEATTEETQRQKQFSRYAHSAVFAEVTVDADLGTIRVPRIVSAVAAGRILNPKTARSQIMGGLVWGIGMALEEESVMDHAWGRFMNANLAEYHIPVHADVHDVDVLFVEENDREVNPLGVKGLGEIGLVGVASAIANAVYHATGKRIRELPITLDRLL